MGKVKNTKKTKVTKKEQNIDESVAEILIGTMLVSTSDFNGGILLEKLVVLFGFVILLVGIIKALPKYREQNKKGMFILLSTVGIVVIFTMIGLVLKLFGVL